MDAQAALQQAHRISALVVGDVMLDAYLIGHVNRISPEAPVPVVDVRQRERRLGGAANVVKNLVALGAQVHIASVVGDDDAGKEIAHLLEQHGAGTHALISTTNRPTTIKTRVISNGQQLLRVDEEQTHDLEEPVENELIQRCEEVLNEGNTDVVIFEDYNKGTLTERVIERLIHRCQAMGIKTAVDPKFRNFSCYRGVSLFKPNLKELQEGIGMVVHKTADSSVETAVKRMHESLSPGISMVTLSERGVCYYAPEEAVPFQRIPAFEREILDVSGAGDAVIAVAAVLLAHHVPVWQIAAVANLAGGLVCEKVGVVPVSSERLQEEWKKHKANTAARLDQK